ncbi:MAG TPA: hypothetical protein VE360_09615 [Pyrinomonadaceae bacterium]|nr:hypothetical protein [Pyrinomonadaceae bacterium]
MIFFCTARGKNRLDRRARAGLEEGVVSGAFRKFIHPRQTFTARFGGGGFGCFLERGHGAHDASGVG